MKIPKRAGARAMWAKVAAGELDDPALRKWLTERARALLAADDLNSAEDSNARRLAIVQAVELYGSKRDTAREREFIRGLCKLLGIENHEAPGPAAPPSDVKAPTPAEIHSALREIVVTKLGLPLEDLSTPDGRERINARIRVARQEGK